jgi:hypothetical protein
MKETVAQFLARGGKVNATAETAEQAAARRKRARIAARLAEQATISEQAEIVRRLAGVVADDGVVPAADAPDVMARQHAEWRVDAAAVVRRR